jgi:hypothetical protein
VVGVCKTDGYSSQRLAGAQGAREHLTGRLCVEEVMVVAVEAGFLYYRPHVERNFDLMI